MRIPESSFIYIDICICLVLLVLMITGFVKGFLYELISIIFSVLSALLAWFVAPIFANLYPLISLDKLYPEYALIKSLFNLDSLLNTFAYFLIIFLILKLCYWFIALLFKGMNKLPVIGKFNKILGLLLGLFNGLLICLALSMLLTLPLFKNGNEVKNSTVLKYTNKLNTQVLNYVANNIDLNNIKKQFDDFDIDNARDDLKEWLTNINE